MMLTLSFASAQAYTPQFVDDDRKIPLKWKTKKIPIAISNSVFKRNGNIKSQSNTLEAIKRSLKSWETAANIEFELSFTHKDSVSKKGTSGDGISLITIAQTSENLLLFDDDLENSSAITRLFYTAKGEIKEADIVLNPIQLFSSDGTFGSFDIEATVTHEIGHLLGLGHSNVLGSTMHTHQGRNGIYNLDGFSSRTLSDDDKSGMISLYGERKTDVNCCGRIRGKLNDQTGQPLRNTQVWLEDFESGRVIAGTTTDIEGDYLIEGIPKSSYKIYAKTKDLSLESNLFAEVDLSKEDLAVIDGILSVVNKDFRLKYLGLNGQLANIAVPVVAGETYTIYVAGENLEPKDLSIYFESDSFSVAQDSILKHEYGKNIFVLSFEVEVAENAENGDYSFYLKHTNGETENFVGGLTVENPTN